MTRTVLFFGDSNTRGYGVGRERRFASLVEKALAPCSWLAVERVGNNVVARTDLGRDQRLVLAGHLDTVPPGENAAPRRLLRPGSVGGVAADHVLAPLIESGFVS